MGGLFIVVVMFFPDGLAGIYNKYKHKFKWFTKFIASDIKADAKTTEIKGVKA
jgi:urea transport system permease protein